MGIRKKISLGFLCLGVMLAFSGMISMFELNRMSRNTSELLESNTYSMDLSKRMLDAVQEQNTCLLQMIVLQKETYDPAFITARDQFEKAFAAAESSSTDLPEIDSIYSAKSRYYDLVDKYFRDAANTDIEWFLQMYKTGYYELAAAVKNHMMKTQAMLMTKASQLKNNAYRAITPGIITLCVAILMVLMFAFLIDCYYTLPTVRITRGLRDFVVHNVPFNVTVEGRDEVARLKEYIDSLISMYKNKK